MKANFNNMENLAATEFAALMVEKIESLSADWKQPWFNVGRMTTADYLPQNITKRHYYGGNAFLLYILCELRSFTTPVFLTFLQAQSEGIKIRKGAKSFPVYYLLFLVFHRVTGEQISFEAYKKMSQAEQEKYYVLNRMKFYRVFNLDQTNFSEVYPGRWDDYKNKFTVKAEPRPENPQLYAHPLIDEMLKLNKWVCPIHLKEQNRAFYSPGDDYIQLPLKSQFFEGEAFYATLLHEMAHSTGHVSRLNRPMITTFGTPEYAKEELIAELSSALCGMFLGVNLGIREENAAYLKGWITTIKQEPKFLFAVLSDAMKAVKFICDVLGVRLEAEETAEPKPTTVIAA